MNLPPSQSAPDIGDRLMQFEAEWSSGRIPDVAGYLHEIGESDRSFVEDVIEIDLEYRWKQFGASSDCSPRDPHDFPTLPLLDDYAALVPEALRPLIFSPRCIAEEYRVRSRWGDKPSRDNILERFPDSDRTAIEDALHQIDTEFLNEGILISEESSLSRAAAAEPTMILGQSAQRDSSLIPEAQLIGTRIGKYLLETRLGHGAFGEVWKAHDPDLNRHVAIKFPRTDKVFRSRILATFRAEAQKLAALDHIPSGIVDVYDCGEHNGKPYFVSKLIDGENLADRMRRERLSHEESAALIARLADTLKRAHKQKLVHRDIKPANILLDKEGEPYLADFGMAITDEEQLDERGGVLGTIAYMAPEQARGESHRVDGRADIYALGVILYRLLTNELPYGGKTTEQFLENIQHQNPRPPKQLDDTIPAELERICLKCLRKDEDERYSSAAELARVLKRARNQPTKKTYVSISVVTAILLTGVALFAFNGSRTIRPDILAPPDDDKKSTESSIKQLKSESRLEELATPFEWYQLLQTKPDRLTPKADENDKVIYDETANEVFMQSPSVTTVIVGETQSIWYKLEVDINKLARHGSSGVVLGLQPKVYQQGLAGWSGQAFWLEPANDNHLLIRRMLIEYKPIPRGQTFLVIKHPLASVLVPYNEGELYRLSITIDPARIREFRCAGLNQPELCDPPNDGTKQKRECRGKIGLINRAGSVTFSDFRFMHLRGD